MHVCMLIETLYKDVYVVDIAKQLNESVSIGGI